MTYHRGMPRIEPAPAAPDGNAVSNSLLARVMGRRPDILQAFGKLDTVIRFHGLLPMELKEAVRRTTAGEIGCVYCASLGEPKTEAADRRESLAVAVAQLIAEDPTSVDDATFAVLREEFSDEEIVELVAWICLVAIPGQLFGAVMGLEAATPEEAAEYHAVLDAAAARR
jgi:alkylhydroperoxidase family enzyme